MGSLATHARMLDATVPAAWPPRAEAMREINDPLRIGLIAATVQQPDERLLAILLADRAMTAEEAAYVAACERAGEGLS